MIELFSIFRGLMDNLLTALAFLPVPVFEFFDFVVGFFKVYLVVKLLRLLWDALPAI